MSEEPKTLVRVFLEEAARVRPNTPFEIVEVPFPDLEQFLAAVSEDRLICGTRLFTIVVEPRVYEVVSRSPVAFRGRAVVRADLPHGRYVEAGGGHG